MNENARHHTEKLLDMLPRQLFFFLETKSKSLHQQRFLMLVGMINSCSQFRRHILLEKNVLLKNNDNYPLYLHRTIANDYVEKLYHVDCLLNFYLFLLSPLGGYQ